MSEINPPMAVVPQEVISLHAFAKKLHALKQSSSEMPLISLPGAMANSQMNLLI